MKILVIGGAGFIGRHACRALLAAGHEVVIGTRFPERALAPPLAGAKRRAVHMERMTKACDWFDVLADIDAVLNCVGILRERPGESYRRVHCDGPLALAAAASACGVARLVHISALGLGVRAASGFIRSKWEAEQGLRGTSARATTLSCCIVRPSLLDGPDGFGARWIRALATLPVLALPAAARGRLAVLDVRDLADALCALVQVPLGAGCHVFELGGAERRTLAEHVAALRRARGRAEPWHIKIPGVLAYGLAWLCDVLHFSPFSRGHLELLARDNLPLHNDLAALLGRAPRAIGAAAEVAPEASPAVFPGLPGLPVISPGAAPSAPRPGHAVRAACGRSKGR